MDGEEEVPEQDDIQVEGQEPIATGFESEEERLNEFEFPGEQDDQHILDIMGTPSGMDALGSFGTEFSDVGSQVAREPDTGAMPAPPGRQFPWLVRYGGNGGTPGNTTWQICLPGCSVAEPPANSSFCTQNGTTVSILTTEITIFAGGPWYTLNNINGTVATPITEIWALATKNHGGTSQGDWAVNPDATVQIQFYDQNGIDAALIANPGADAAGLCWLICMMNDSTTVTLVAQHASCDRVANGIIGDGDATPAGPSSIHTISPGRLEITGWSSSGSSFDLTSGASPAILAADSNGVGYMISLSKITLPSDLDWDVTYSTSDHKFYQKQRNNQVAPGNVIVGCVPI